MISLPGGGIATARPGSNSGPKTIDVKYPDGTKEKNRFTESTTETEVETDGENSLENTDE